METKKYFSLSYGQKSLWFYQQSNPHSYRYNLTFAAKVISALDVEKLCSALQQLVAKYKTLRTVFEIVDNQLVQSVRAYQIPEISIIDANSWSEDEINLKIKTEGQRPFDLGSGCLLRAVILLRTKEPVFLLSIHHIAVDLWSMASLVADLGRAYSGKNIMDGFREAPDYQDYVNYQSQQILEAEFLEQDAFWESYLAGDLPLVSLPTDFPRPAKKSERGAIERFHIPKELVTGLRKFSLEHGVTLYVTLLTAYFLLLHRYTGQAELILGSPFSGRTVSHFRRIFGFFVNPVVLRATISEEKSFLELLADIQQHVAQVFQHQDFPFSLLVEKKAYAYDPSRSPLYDVEFVYDRPIRLPQIAPFILGEAGGQLVLDELGLESLPIQSKGIEKDLQLFIADDKETLYCALHYAMDLFEAATIKNMAGQYIAILNSLLAFPQEKLKGHRFSIQKERIDLGQKSTNLPIPTELTWLNLFEQQVAARPQAIAIYSEDDYFTFKQTLHIANHIATQLLNSEVLRGDIVAICLPRTASLLFSILGIQKAGAMYLPLDEQAPDHRIQEILKDAQPKVVIVSDDNTAMKYAPGCRTINIDSLFIEEALLTDQVEVAIPVTGEDFAYVIYTSGSSGTPKGVMVQHRSVVNLFYALSHSIEVYGSGRYLKIGVNAPVFFDSSIKQLIMLAGGHALDIIPADIRLSSLDFLTYIHLRALDVIDMTPSQIELLLVDSFLMKYPLCHKTILIGGEKVGLQLWEKIRRVEKLEAYNVYGPTECTVDTTAVCISHKEHSLPTLGCVLANMQLYLLDSYLNPVSSGMVGELYIGGTGVSNGYLRKPGLTAARFIPNPFSFTPGARLYKTGDLARYRSNGSLEYLGRSDFQIKLRGYRIELGDIETALMSHSQIRQCVVTPYSIGEVDGLVAYVISNLENEEPLSASALQAHLAEKLPRYMIPSHYIFMDAFPVTSNGKLDLRKLPVVQDHLLGQQMLPLKPESAVEQWLSSLWQRLLHVEPAINDNFFVLGGHSLLVMQVITRIQEEYQVKIEIAQFFEKPTIRDLASLIEAGTLGPAESAYNLAKMINRPTRFYASYQQRRLWFLEQLQSSPAYNITGAVQFDGAFNFDLFVESLTLIEKNQEILRTAFEGNEEGVFQRVIPIDVCDQSREARVSYTDLRNYIQPELAIAAQAKSESLMTFDLSKGCLWRVCVMMLAEEKHVVILTMHHLISDGWSNQLFLQALIRHYEHLVYGSKRELLAPALQYIDYTHWQREWSSSLAMEEQLNYWQEKLSQANTQLNLPTDYSRPLTQQYEGASCVFEINIAVKNALEALARKTSTTLFMLLTAIFKLLLFRYSGQEDVLLGTPVAGRRSKEMETMLGLFANTVVLRSQLHENMPFNELLEQVKNTTLEAFEHQDCPFDQVVEAVNPPRDLSYSPLFQVMFIVNNRNTEPLSRLMNISSFLLERTTAKFDLSFEIEVGDSLKGLVEYNTALFQKDSIERMMGHYQTLVQAVIANPLEPLKDYSLMTALEYQHLQGCWGSKQELKLPQNDVIRLFEQQVSQYPERRAVVYDSTVLTYQELNHQVNQLARLLLDCGVQKGQVIGIFLPREPSLIIALLAVLKIRAIYLPLDPAYPPKRTQTILATAQASLVISKESVKKALPDSATVKILCLDQQAACLIEQAKENLHCPVSLSDEAYLIYTSGSTGVPKGVVITHQNLGHFIEWAHTVFYQAFSAVLASTSVCFDLSVFEIFGTLTCGGQLYLVENALALLNSPDNYPVKLINTVPSAIRELVNANAVPDTVTTINLAGEPLVHPLVESIYRSTQVSRIYNLYGPTETTTYSTYALLPKESPLTACSIGRPIANTFIYILDSHLNPVPLGIAGEIYIGGLGVAQGYWNNPELTKERFLPDLFCNRLGSVMYKTGDLGKFLPDGQLFYLGRLDQQVKLRGYRIELTEIEAVLSLHTAVDSAVVVSCLNRHDEASIVAYVRLSKPLATELLQKHIKCYLPEYMLPSLFMFIEELPLLANGKVNRSLLPVPDWNAGLGLAKKQKLLTTFQRDILDIWKAVLGHDQIDLDDNFFMVGGHSLLATRVLLRVNERFGLKLPIRTLFEYSRLIDFAGEIEKARAENKVSTDDSIPLVSRNERLVPSDAQQRMWLLHQFYGQSNHYNMVAAFQFKGYFEEHLLARVLKAIVLRHEILRTHFQVQEGILFQCVSDEPSFIFSSEECTSDKVTSYIKEEANSHFDLTTGPLLKVKLLYLEDASAVLIFNMHHIIADGWSIGILIREFSLLWKTFKVGGSSPLESLRVQYADYAAWQQERLQGAALEKQLSYWRQQLSGYSGILPLIPDKLSRYSGLPKAGHLTIELADSTLNEFYKLLQQENATLFMGLTAILAILLHFYTDSEDLAIGTVIANRAHPDLESLIGFFANTLVLRFDLSEDLPFVVFLQQVKTTVLLAYENQDVPFELLVDELKPIRKLHHHPLFQVMLILNNTGVDELELGETQVTSIDAELDHAKFDLLFNMVEKGGCLSAKLDFNADIFATERMEKVLEHLVQLVKAVSQKPEVFISRLLTSENKVHETNHPNEFQTMEDLLEHLVLDN